MKDLDLKAIKSILTEEINYFDTVDYFKDEEGRVLSVGDGIAQVSGLSNVMLNEIVIFETGVQGIVLNLEDDHVGVVMLGKYDDIEENQPVHRTNRVFSIPVGFDFIGRVVDANARPIDGKGPIKSEGWAPVEKIAPGVMKRQSVDQPLETGILSIDSMFPIGKGQRELIIGDRQTGKTTVATDAIINQKGKDVYCIYVAIGQKNSTVAALVKNLEEQGAMEYTTVVSASASELPALQYVAPYTGVTLAEHLMSKGKDVLIVYDDLSKHAVAYRTLSLLLKRPPGREAFPGDVFYLHSRLLERACRLNQANGGGSITALPIIETQAGDISAYIPTNVISITDGQIFMMTSLFNSGQRPAIDAGLSVSRVGGAAQIKSVKSVSGSLKLELANYRELDAFSQFGSDLDEHTKSILEHGKRSMLMLRQLPNQPLSQTDEAILLLTIKQRYIDVIPESRIQEYKKFVLENVNPEYWERLTEAKEFTKDDLDPLFKGHLYELTLEFLNLLKDLEPEQYELAVAFLDERVGIHKPGLKQEEVLVETDDESIIDQLVEQDDEAMQEVSDEGDDESKIAKDLENELKALRANNPFNYLYLCGSESGIIRSLLDKHQVRPKPIGNDLDVIEKDYFFYNFKNKKPFDFNVFPYSQSKSNDSVQSCHSTTNECTNKTNDEGIIKGLLDTDQVSSKPIGEDLDTDLMDYFEYNFKANDPSSHSYQQQSSKNSNQQPINNELIDLTTPQTPIGVIRRLLDEQQVTPQPIGDDLNVIEKDYFKFDHLAPKQAPKRESIFKINTNWGNKISQEEVAKRESEVHKVVTAKEIDPKTEYYTIMISLDMSEATSIIEKGKSALFFKILPVQKVKRVLIYLTKSSKFNGGVIGEFELETKDKMSKTKAWSLFGRVSTLKKAEFDEYYKDSKAVSVMKISDFISYSQPKSIESFGVKKAPASFMYLK